MNIVTIDGDRLVVEPVGLDKLWGFRRRIEVPLEHVRGATYDPGASHEQKGLKAPGLRIPGFKATGTFHREGEKTWWNVRAGQQTIVVELSDETFARLYLTVGDARAVVDRVNAAATA